jgi:CubicO group peptidase (beta-lactamase class C family)
MIDDRHLATSPESVGIDSEKLEAVFARAKRDVDDGILTSAQVAVARQGKLAGIRSYGQATQGGEMRLATDNTLFCIFSATKAIIAAAVWTLFERNLLRLDERLGDIVPEIGNELEAVTVEQCLLHVGGFPRAPLQLDAFADRQARLDAFATWHLDWEPGSRFEYHAGSAHWVLAEIIQRRTGEDFRDYVRATLATPMGLDELFVGMPTSANDRVASVHYKESPAEPPGGWGVVTPEAILNFNQLAVREAGVPGAGGIMSAAELALFYQPLINGGMAADGTRILKPETIEFATTVRTTQQHRDTILEFPVNRALAVVVAGDDGSAHLRGFGRVASARTFGHGGAGGQIGWGDPENGISVGYCTDTFVDELTMGRRVTAISSLAAGCAS